MTRKDWLWIALAALGLSVSLGAAFRYAFRPRPVPAVPTTVAPSPVAAPVVAETGFPTTVVTVPVPERDDAPRPCDGLADAAALACVLASPGDLDSFSDATLAGAERAALRERLGVRTSGNALHRGEIPRVSAGLDLPSFPAGPHRGCSRLSPRLLAGVAQTAERLTRNQQAAGSIYGDSAREVRAPLRQHSGVESERLDPRLEPRWASAFTVSTGEPGGAGIEAGSPQPISLTALAREDA